MLRFLVLALLGASSLPLAAQELEPRSYVNLPIDQTTLVVGYGRTEGDVAPSPTAPIENAFVELDSVALGLAHTFSIAGDSAKFDLQAARTCYDARADVEGIPEAVSRCEWGDLRARVTWNFIGAPALALEDFRAQWKPGFTFGTSLQVEMPTGGYNSDRIVNAGSNRWMIRPGFGASYIWNKWYLDVSGSVKFFGNNDNYLDSEVTQDPLYQAQFHVARYFAPGAWVSFNSNFYYGGESTRGVIQLDDGVENARLGITASMPLSPRLSVRVNVSSGVITTIGSDFDAIGIALQYRL